MVGDYLIDSYWPKPTLIADNLQTQTKEIVVVETARSAIGTNIEEYIYEPYKTVKRPAVMSPVSLPNILYQQYRVFTDVLMSSGSLDIDPGFDLHSAIGSNLDSRYPFYRPEITYTLKFICNPYVYGRAVIVYLPDAINDNLQEVFNAKPFFLDLNKGGIVNIKIPYINHRPYIRAQQFSQMGRIRVTYRVHSLSSTAPNPTVISYVKADSLEPRGSAQMGDASYTMAGLVTTALLTFNAAKGALETIKETAGSVQNTVTLAGRTKEAVEQAVQTVKETVGVSNKENEDLPTKVEKPVPNRTQSMTSTYIANNPLGAFVGPGVSIENFGTMNYSANPMVVADSNLRHSFRDICTTPQWINTITLLKADQMIIPVQPVQPRIITVNKSLASVPNYFGGYGTYQELASQLFGFWRGSMHYKFIFRSCSFMVAEYEIGVNYDPIDYPPISQLIPMKDNYVQRITVQGTYEHDVWVPFLSTKDWISTSCSSLWSGPIETIAGKDTTRWCPEPVANIYIRPISQVSTGDIEMEHHIDILMKCGDDIQFRRPYIRRGIAQSGMICDYNFNHCLMENPHLLRLNAIPEDNMTVEDFMRQWSQTDLYFTSVNGVYNHYFTTNYFSLDPAGDLNYSNIPTDVYLAQQFGYIRGSFEYKVVPDAAITDQIAYATASLSIDNNLSSTLVQPVINNGATIRDTSYNKIVDGSFDIEDTYEWHEHVWPYAGDKPIKLRYSNLTIRTTLYTRAAPNIQCALMKGPPLRYRQPMYIGVLLAGE